MPVSPPLTASKIPAANDYPILSDNVKIRQRAGEPALYQIDREPLGNRKPLVMVHGLKGEFCPKFRWGKVIKRFRDYPPFNRSYKVYLLRYNSATELRNSVPRVKELLLGLRRQSQANQLAIMALSLGGNLVQDVMQDSQVNDAVEMVFSLATPLHGSPLFSTDWLQYSIYKNFYQPWTRIDHSLAYRLYFKLNANLVADLRWDNCDRFVPDAGEFRSRLPFGPHGTLTPETAGNPRLLAMNTRGKIDKSKWITYAGYMTNPYMFPALRRDLESAILYPAAFVTWKLPSHLAREHPVLSLINRDISRVIPANDPHVKGERLQPYALNDGITPVTSALYLPAEVCRQIPLAHESELPKVAGMTDVRLARVFKNVDHLTFVDGCRPRPHNIVKLIGDQLNPKDGLRTMFDWILSDLMQFEPTPSQLAKESGSGSKLQD